MLSKFSVKKPYTVVVAIVLVLILGVVSYTNMSVDLIPSFNLPYAVISTSYPGASPEEVEQTVTNPLEQGMASISNVKNISSVSSEHSSMVILEFNEDTNMDSSMIEMRETLDMLTAYFPDGVGSPIIMKLNPDMMPIVSTAVSVEGMEDKEAASYIDEKVIPEIESVPGVASVTATGLISNMIDVTLSQEKIDALNQKVREFYLTEAEEQIRSEARRQIRSQVDTQLEAQRQALLAQGMPEEMADSTLEAARQQLYAQVNSQAEQVVQSQLGKIDIPEIDITKDMVSGLLAADNFSMPSGSVSSEDGSSYLVRVGDKFSSAQELGAMTLMEIPDYGPVTLSEVADVLSYDNSGTMYSRVNGNYAMILSLQKQPDYSTADVANSVQARMDEITEKNASVRFDILMDQGEYVDLMIQTIIQNLVFGGVLAIIILLIFLRRIKPTLIVGASIVISVITAFVLMYFSGITLNMISMGGLALGVGMLVDNSIVVIENIFRFRSQGMGAKEAAIQGAKEVTGAITASTVTTVIVFLPIVFTHGMTRQLFTDMALTIAYSLLASLLVALTLVPAAAGAMLKKPLPQKKTWVDRMTNGYARLLNHSLNHKWFTIALVVVLLFGSVFAAFSMGTQLFPSMDSGRVTISVTMPDNYTQEQSFAALDDLTQELETVDDVETIGVLGSSGESSDIMSMLGGGNTVYVQLKESRSISTDEAVQQIRDKTEGKEYEVSVSGSNMDLSMLSGGDVVYHVYSTDLDSLRAAAVQVADIISATEGTAEVDHGLGKTNMEARITVDKDKAIAKGLTVAQVYQAVSERLETEKAVTSLNEGGVSYDVYVKDSRISDMTLEQLENIEIASGDTTVKVGEIAEVSQAEGFVSIQHDGQERYVSVTASVENGYLSSAVNEEIQQKLGEAQLPDGCRVEVAGESESIANTFRDLILMLVLAVVFIYLVMVAQFQSFLSPFIVMFTIPLAFTGGFLALFFAGMPVSVVAMIGFVVLVGIVVNNAIVFVDYANQQRSKGMTTREALLMTGRTRIRPILMTALTTIIALMTMAFDTSSGGELMRPMAVTTIGGLAYATLLTLFIIPVMYEIFHRNPKKRMQSEGEQQHGGQ